MKLKLFDTVGKPSSNDALIEKHHYLDLFETDHFCLIGDHSLIEDWAADVLLKSYVEQLRPLLSDPDPTTMGRTYEMSGGGSIIWLRPGTKTQVLVHEISHATTHLLRSKSIPLCTETDELIAYLNAHFYRQFATHA